MRQYECDILVNGIRTQTIVTAQSTFDAGKLVKAQYPNCQIQVFTIKQK